ncbi:MAG: ABC transporter permease subunit [Gammaproteobacteria bacterium]|nr:ABC transporter permease subunit [Gammaproteobacteria bacterium]
MMILTLARRELRSLFLSPLAWSILAIVQFILAYLFLSQLQEFLLIQPKLAAIENAPGITELVIVPLYGNAAFIMMLVTPLLTMRLISEERRNKSLPLLMSAPISMTEIIIGKYLGMLGFAAIMIFMMTLMPLSLLFAGKLDAGLLFAIVLGISLLLAAFIALGLYMSSLTAQPTIAAMSTFGMLIMLWIIDWAGNKADAAASGLLEYFSMLRHFEAFSKGVFNSSDFIYYVLFISLFLILSIRRLDSDRLQR